jgi:hypothetical protein
MTVNAPIITPFKWETTAAEVVAGVDLGGSRVIVTGGASGIGVETARALADAGKRVASEIRPTPATPTSWSRLWTSPTRHRSHRSSPRGTNRWTSWSTTPASWPARKPAHRRASSFSSPPIISATSRSPPACTEHSRPPTGPASSRSAPEPTCARRWYSTTSTFWSAPTSRGTPTHSRRPPTCSSR